MKWGNKTHATNKIIKYPNVHATDNPNVTPIHSTVVLQSLSLCGTLKNIAATMPQFRVVMTDKQIIEKNITHNVSIQLPNPSLSSIISLKYLNHPEVTFWMAHLVLFTNCLNLGLLL
jgi:hypothetical protein